MTTTEPGSKQRVIAAAVFDGTNERTPIASTGEGDDIATLLLEAGSTNDERDDIVELELSGDNPLKVVLLLTSERRPTAPAHNAPVLIVDDEQSNRTYYEEVLTSAGYGVEVAATGLDGYRAAQRHNPSLILLDVRLPDTNGYEVCRQIRSQPALDNVPVILMSSDPEMAVESRITSAGAAGFFVAPISSAQLLDRVQRTRRRDPAPIERVAEVTAVSSKTMVQLFGAPRVSSDASTFSIPSGRSFELFATLAIASPNPVSTERLALLVWNGEKGGTPGAVYTAMSRLRSSLAKAGFIDLVESDVNGYRVTLDPSQIDVLAFDQAAGEALRASTLPSAGELQAILDMWRGDPFQGRIDNDLVSRFVVRLHESRARLLENVAVALLHDEAHSEAITALHSLLADEPWREDAWALLVTALYRSGRQRDALNAFQQSRSRMANELGVDPGPRLSSCELMILTHDPKLLSREWVDSLRA